MKNYSICFQASGRILTMQATSAELRRYSKVSAWEAARIFLSRTVASARLLSVASEKFDYAKKDVSSTTK